MPMLPQRDPSETYRAHLRDLFWDVLSSSAGKVLWDVLGRALSFILSLYIARTLGATGYGQFAVVWYLAWMTSQATDLGVHLVTLRNMSREEAAERSSRALGEAMVAKALLTLLTFTVYLASCLGKLGLSTEIATALLYYAAALSGSWVELLGVALRSRGSLAREGVVLALLRAGWLVGALLTLGAGGDIEEVGLGLSLCSLPALVIAIVSVFRRVPPAWVRFGWGRFRRLLRQAAPLGLTAIITVLYLRLDVLLLSLLDGDESAGLFTAAFRLFEGLFLFSGGIVAGAFPLIAARVGRSGSAAVNGFVLRLLLWIGIPLAACLAVLGKPIIELLYGSGYEGSVVPVEILAAAVVAVYINALSTHLLVAAGRGRTLVSVMLVRLVVGVSVDCALIPSLGPAGAALAVVAAEWSLTAASLASVRNSLEPVTVLQAAVLPAASTIIMVGAVSAVGTPLAARIVMGAAAYVAAFFTFSAVAHLVRGRKDMGGVATKGRASCS